MKPKDQLWWQFSGLFSRYISGKMTKKEFEDAWAAKLKDEGVTQEEFSAKYGRT
jgi:hypothetical protein